MMYNVIRNWFILGPGEGKTNYCVNLPDTVVRTIHQLYLANPSNPSPDLFDEAVKQIYNLVASNTLLSNLTPDMFFQIKKMVPECIPWIDYKRIQNRSNPLFNST